MGLVFYSMPENPFSDLYLKVRALENRLYDDAQVKSLPILHKNDPHSKEWKRRQYSASRFLNYLKSKNASLRILDIGCGNGWFSHLMSTDAKMRVTGLDINLTELEQAARIFEKDNLEFVYADLFSTTELNNRKFDIIVFNSCLQYFENLPRLFEVINSLLTAKGEIHVLDTPFYASHEVGEAKQRTKNYFSDLGFPEMSNNYYHHCFENLGSYSIMHKPRPFPLRYLKNDSPFYWLRLNLNSKIH